MEDVGFGELLRDLRATAGLSQEELAERARLSPGAISALERGVRRAPQHQTLGLLVEALQLSAPDRDRIEAAASTGRRRGARTASNAGAPPHNLPNVLTSFHGRARDLADLDRLTESRRLITLLGAGGVGKTRLALEAARALLAQSRFPDGTWFVELAPLGAPDLVTSAIAQVAGIREHAGEALLDTLAAALATKTALVFLDNCEHLIDECARVSERLARDCPGLVIIATTREALRVDGECVVRIEPLAYDDERRVDPALDLFVDRLIDADFVRFSSLSDADRAHAAAICERLDGIPLALELAAGRARDLPLAQIVAGLDERFTLLSDGRRTAAPRQHTLRGMIDWSFALLSAAEQELFARLGLFAGTFTPEAAAQICGERPPLVRDGLGALIAKSLVTVVEDREGRMRYRLLETMRAYALDRFAESAGADAVAHRFARFFRATAQAADHRYGRIPNHDFLPSVEPELDNFRAALMWTLGARNDLLLGAELAGALGWVYRQTSLFAEGTRWCEKALEETAVLPSLIAGRLHMALSFFYFNMGRMQPAFDAARSATAAYDTGRNPTELAWALTQQGYCLYLLGRADDARDAAARAVATARGQDHPLRLAGALNAFALTIPLERAAERFAPLEEAIRAYRAAGDQGAIVPTANLAETHYATGNYAAALACGLDVVAMTRKNRDRSNLAAALTNVAAYALTVDDVAQAGEAAGEALGLVRDVGKTLNAMCALQHLGSVAARRGAYERAARLAGASNRLYAEFGLAREFTEQSLYDRTIVDIRGGLDDAALQILLDEGAAMPLEDTIAYALLID